MNVGVGYGNEGDAYASGRMIARAALVNGAIGLPGLVLAFCGGQVNAEEYYRGLRSVVGTEVPIIGGSAVGIITNDHLSYEGFPAGAAILGAEHLELRVASAGELDKDERQAGKRLADQVSCEEGSKLLLLFYDSVKVPPTATTPPIMNASPRLIQGMEESLRGCVPIIGAGVIGDFIFSPTTQFCGSSVGSQRVVAALLGGNVAPYHTIMHGCTPKDGIYRTITRIKGQVIYEFDGRPAARVIDDIYGDQQWRTQVPVRRLTVGVNHGDRFGTFQEGEYVNRLIAGVLPEEDGIVIFEPDLEEGTEILFMLRDSEKMMDSVRTNAVALLERISADGRKPVFGLYIDCAGRTANVSETLTEEADELRTVCNRYRVPLLGFYSGVEIAPLLGTSRGLDWTGVFLVLCER
ncbi:MAG: hypothetical protein HGA43_07980 [Nitrospirae bacterium]|nr:hypothetical protein [Nitrospirota bacterium]